MDLVRIEKLLCGTFAIFKTYVFQVQNYVLQPMFYTYMQISEDYSLLSYFT